MATPVKEDFIALYIKAVDLYYNLVFEKAFSALEEEPDIAKIIKEIKEVEGCSSPSVITDEIEHLNLAFTHMLNRVDIQYITDMIGDKLVQLNAFVENWKPKADAASEVAVEAEALNTYRSLLERQAALKAKTMTREDHLEEQNILAEMEYLWYKLAPTSINDLNKLIVASADEVKQMLRILEERKEQRAKEAKAKKETLEKHKKGLSQLKQLGLYGEVATYLKCMDPAELADYMQDADKNQQKPSGTVGLKEMQHLFEMDSEEKIQKYLELKAYGNKEILGLVASKMTERERVVADLRYDKQKTAISVVSQEDADKMRAGKKETDVGLGTFVRVEMHRTEEEEEAFLEKQQHDQILDFIGEKKADQVLKDLIKDDSLSHTPVIEGTGINLVEFRDAIELARKDPDFRLIFCGSDGIKTDYTQAFIDGQDQVKDETLFSQNLTKKLDKISEKPELTSEPIKVTLVGSQEQMGPIKTLIEEDAEKSGVKVNVSIEEEKDNG